MVERVWSARTPNRDGAAAYAAYFRRVVLPELTAVGGYRGAMLLQRLQEPRGVEFSGVTADGQAHGERRQGAVPQPVAPGR